MPKQLTCECHSLLHGESIPQHATTDKACTRNREEYSITHHILLPIRSLLIGGRGLSIKASHRQPPPIGVGTRNAAMLHLYQYINPTVEEHSLDVRMCGQVPHIIHICNLQRRMFMVSNHEEKGSGHSKGSVLHKR